jgi:hypothetical protein
MGAASTSCSKLSRTSNVIRPRGMAIWIYAVRGLAIAYCRIEGVEASAEMSSYVGGRNPLASAVFVGSNPVPPQPGQEEQPENNSGTLSIFNNDIDVGGTAGDPTLGIVVFGVGKTPDKEVDLNISGNNIRNITERPINVYSIGGRVHIERNVITTGVIVGPAAGAQPDAIHVVGSGSYLIAHNSILSEWATGAGIRVQGNTGLSEASAIVVDNDVIMQAPEGAVFGANSAGIEIRGLAQDNVVLNNKVRGRARAALSVVGGGGTPASNTFVANNIEGFHSSLADVFIDAGVTNTLITARKGTTIEDHGRGTVVVPMP